MNKIFFIGGGVVLLILIIGVFYLSPQTAITPQGEPIFPVTPAEKEIITEQESLNQDIADLETLAEDASLDNLDQDLADVAEGENAAAGNIIVDNLEEEFSFELEGLSDDLNTLEGFDSDSSLDNIDGGLSGIAE